MSVEYITTCMATCIKVNDCGYLMVRLNHIDKNDGNAKSLDKPRIFLVGH